MMIRGASWSLTSLLKPPAPPRVRPSPRSSTWRASLHFTHLQLWALSLPPPA